jgi:hypothetical protein
MPLLWGSDVWHMPSFLKRVTCYCSSTPKTNIYVFFIIQRLIIGSNTTSIELHTVLCLMQSTKWQTTGREHLVKHDPCNATRVMSLIPTGVTLIQWGKKVFSQPPIVQVLPLKKMREACNFIIGTLQLWQLWQIKRGEKIQKITL